MSGVPSKAVQPRSVTVWDPVLRAGHWFLVVLFAIVYLTAEEESGSTNVLHVWGGYAIGAIVVLRVLWGFAGPPYARFSSFVCGPATSLRYLVDLVGGHARRYLGHSPAGGAMVVALLVFLAATVASGVVAYGERGKGPLAVDGAAIVTSVKAEEGSEGKTGKETAIAEVYGVLANITLGLIILHVLGVGVASYAHRENLVAAMLSGRKRAAE
jgi:cytochrome b